MEKQENMNVTSQEAEKAEVKNTVDTKLQQEQRRESIHKAIAALCEKFPKAFVASGPAKPLKIGIINDIKERINEFDDISLSKLRSAVRIYTFSLNYLKSIKEGAKRVDLDGNEVSEVTKEHADYSLEQIKAVTAKLKEQGKLKPKFNKTDKKPFKNKKPVNVHTKRSFVKQNVKSADSNTVPAKLEDLVKGANVLVSSNNRFVKGTVTEEAKQNTVMITLDSGLTVCVPVARVMLKK